MFETHSSPGFHVNSAVLQTIVSRHADAQYAIDFDSFVGCLIKLEMLFSKCQRAHTHTHISIVSVCCVIRASSTTSLFPAQKCSSLWKKMALEQLNWICNRCVKEQRMLLVQLACCANIHPVPVF